MRKTVMSLTATLALATAALVGIASPAQAKPPAPAAVDNILGKPTPPLSSARPKGVLAGTKLHALPQTVPSAGGVTTLSQPTCGTPSPGCFYYAGERQDGMTSDGAGVALPITDGYKNSNDNHTLTELAVQSTDSQQIVEIGITKDPAVNGGSTTPHLFVGSWTNNAFNGYNGGGYINVSGCSPCAGADLAASIGSTVNLAVQHFTNAQCGCTAGWWVGYGSNWIGVFPDSVWSGAYVLSGLIQVFGEIVSVNTSAPCSDMEIGKFASDGSASAAVSYVLINGSTAAGWTGSIETDSTKYSVQSTSGTAFRYGGPGWNSIGTATGATGSCAPATAGTNTASAMNLWREICPDGSTTGCNLAVAQTSAPLNTCIAAPSGQINNYKNTTGVRWYFFHTSNCTGASTSVGPNAGGNFNSSWNNDQINGFYRSSQTS